MSETISIAIADDHVVLRNGLAELIKKLGYTVLFESSNGKELIAMLEKSKMLPDLVLMDISMPQMDGYDATKRLKEQYPEIKVIALTIYDDEASIIRMVRNGARGYLLKSAESKELKQAIESVCTIGYYYSDIVTGYLLHSINKNLDAGSVNVMNEREMEFLKWAATELTYKEIAGKMKLKERTIDGYRQSLFEKLNVKSRIGLVLFAIKNRIVILY